MKIYRTEEAIFGYQTMRSQVLEAFLFGLVEGRKAPFSFEVLCDMCSDDLGRSQMLYAVVELMDDGILVEMPNRDLVLASPNRAKVEAGFFTEEDLDLVPEGVNVMCLSDSAQEMIDEMGIDKAVEEMAADVVAAMDAKMN